MNQLFRSDVETAGSECETVPAIYCHRPIMGVRLRSTIEHNDANDTMNIKLQ